ncbi:hypothetical protein [Vibrio harveyi]|uniref:hypothetical protein n=1 Tax=Vibrio harveyi TaxID=669 RepID=UPI003CFBBE19
MKRLFLASLVSATLIGCGGSDGGDKKPTTPEQPDTSIPTTPLEPSTPVDPENPDQPLIPLEPSLTPPTSQCNETEDDCWDNGFEMDLIRIFASSLNITLDDAETLCYGETFSCYFQDNSAIIKVNDHYYYPVDKKIKFGFVNVLAEQQLYNKEARAVQDRAIIKFDVLHNMVSVSTPMPEFRKNKEGLYELYGYAVFDLDANTLNDFLIYDNAETKASSWVYYSNGWKEYKWTYSNVGIVDARSKDSDAFYIFEDVLNYWTTQ